MLPKTLQTAIKLKNLGKIEILNKINSTSLYNTRIFIKKYVPSIRYYNENLKFVRTVNDSAEKPLIKIFNITESSFEEFEAEELNAEEILSKIEKLNDKFKEIN